MNLVQEAPKILSFDMWSFKPTKTLGCCEVCPGICLPSPLKSPLIMRENQKPGKNRLSKTYLTIILTKFQNMQNCHFIQKAHDWGQNYVCPGLIIKSRDKHRRMCPRMTSYPPLNSCRSPFFSKYKQTLSN